MMQELDHALAQLRHAYSRLWCRDVQGDQREFARGMIGPQIEILERIREQIRADQKKS